MIPTSKPIPTDVNTLTDKIFAFLSAHNGQGDLSKIPGLAQAETLKLVTDPLIQKGYITTVYSKEGFRVSLTAIGLEIAKWRKP